MTRGNELALYEQHAANWWTADRRARAIAWSLYCIVGPLHKERRFPATYGEHFQRYRARTPYLLPRIF